MKLLVFTSNGLRHKALLNTLATAGHQVVAYLEYKPSHKALEQPKVLQRYFDKVKQAESDIFGHHTAPHPSIQVQTIPFGQLTSIDADTLDQQLSRADAVIVFGSSYIKSPLVEKLIQKQAINLHMGISPQYRGVGCNFWALFDGHPSLVGATIHYLDHGLDSGKIIRLVRPSYQPDTSPFHFTMAAVQAGHQGLVALLDTEPTFTWPTTTQDPSQQIRYTRARDFSAIEAQSYFDNEANYINMLQQFANTAPPVSA